MPNKTLATIRADNPPGDVAGDELIYAVKDGDDTAYLISELLSAPSVRTTLELTADTTLLASASGVDLYTVPGTSDDIDVTVPAGLGDGFFTSVFHEGGGSLAFVGSGVTVSPPPDGTLLLSQGMYASLQVFGSDAVVKLIGRTVPA